jgi:glycosyltransferase involved in cell wall biosynthesis
MPFNAFIVLPAFNEEEGIREFLNKLGLFLETHPQLGSGRFDWNLVVVNDGSQDNTVSVVRQASKKCAFKSVSITSVSLIRNFGHQAALLAGLRVAASKKAHFVITMDADGEHPMELIPSLVTHWQRGAPIVHTSRNATKALSKFKGLTSSLYYASLRLFAHLEIQNGMADYKLWDGQLLRSVRSYLNTCGSTRAFASWLVPNAPVVPYDQSVIEGRHSRFTIRKMLSLALNSVVRFSEFPIRLAFYIGLLGLGLGTLLIIFAVVAFYMGKVIPGWTSTVALIVFFGGIQSFLLGIYGEYFLRNLFRSNLPSFVVETEPVEPQSEDEDDVKLHSL